MTDTADSFRQGATAFKNARDLTKEYRNAAIARANETTAQTIEDEKEKEETNEETEEKEDMDDNEAEAEAESSNTVFSFDCRTK